ncbi:hypothetical protein JX265_012484 [Neoarthrinium moseri]|uniref:Low affinity iron transporter n=1 Tax=Neoarthrinium moseri TaxID=1658444 RepID=A0A9P9WAR0_9PEZI|nr:hypothetical protein JX265_012484 [Neoarthrinium moseri]
MDFDCAQNIRPKSLIGRLTRLIRAPGSMEEVTHSAPVQLTPSHQRLDADSHGAIELLPSASRRPPDLCQDPSGSALRKEAGLSDRWLDAVVRFSGSQFTLLMIVFGLLIWAFLGIPFGNSVSWAVIISNVQAIVCYIYDSLLMRQQHNEYKSGMRVAATLQSRAISHTRMVREVVGSGRYVTPSFVEMQAIHEVTMAKIDLPAEKWLDRISTTFSDIIGHMATISLFWICIFIWIGFGPSTGWSDEWQLYINSSTSALMLLIFAFLANVRERHGVFTAICLDSLCRVDAEVELNLRALTGDEAPNPQVTIPPPEISRVQRAIFYYASVVGTMVGIVLLMAVLVVWLAIGPLMSFNDNWWLLIGTYAGLIGMHDGFVLDNVQSRLQSYVNDAFEEVHHNDFNTLNHIHIQSHHHHVDLTLNQRISTWVVTTTSHPSVVLIGIVCIVGLLIGATAMEWSTTGQLLCNVPPSIIESFFMMLVITGHNMADRNRRLSIQSIHLRRLTLLEWCQRLRTANEYR